MRNAIKVAAIVAYASIAVFTFGHSAGKATKFQDQHCVTADQRIAVGSRCYMSAKAPEAMFAAILWPLYWSWELQS